jgi:hypothetical protein
MAPQSFDQNMPRGTPAEMTPEEMMKMLMGPAMLPPPGVESNFDNPDFVQQFSR